MTSLLKHPAEDVAPWSMMPGWGVVADLTPPELIEMRRLRSLRKVIGLALAAVLVLCVAGYVFAMFKESSKQSDLDATRDQGSSLAAQKNKYANVTRLKSTTDSIDTQISTLMANEVDVAALMTKLRDTLPGSMAITSMNVALSNGDATAAAAAVPAATPGTTGGNVIGTVTLSGNAQRMADVADYIDALRSMKGVTAVLPGSNTAGTAGTASWSMTLSVTDALLTHRYDTKSGAASVGGN